MWHRGAVAPLTHRTPGVEKMVNIKAVQKKELALQALRRVAQWMEVEECSRLRLLHKTRKIGWSCEQWRPDHSHGKLLPLREPWRWIHQGGQATFCVECLKRMTRCLPECQAHLMSRTRRQLEQACEWSDDE